MRVAQFSSVPQSCPTLCDPMDIRPPCPSPTPRAYSNSCPSSRWCHPAISSSVVPFSCFQSFPASGSFPVCQFFTSVSIAIDPPRSQGMTPDTEHRGTMLSILWVLVLLWILSIHLACFYFCIPLGSKKTLLLSTLKIYFSLYKVGGVGEKQPFSVPTLSPLSSGIKVLRPLTRLRLWYF